MGVLGAVTLGVRQRWIGLLPRASTQFVVCVQTGAVQTHGYMSSSVYLDRLSERPALAGLSFSFHCHGIVHRNSVGWTVSGRPPRSAVKGQNLQLPTSYCSEPS